MKLGAKKQKATDDATLVTSPTFESSFNPSYRRDEAIGEINFISDSTRKETDFSISWSYVSDSTMEEEAVIERKYEFITEWSIPIDNEEDSSLSRYSSDFIVDWR